MSFFTLIIIIIIINIFNRLLEGSQKQEKQQQGDPLEEIRRRRAEQAKKYEEENEYEYSVFDDSNSSEVNSDPIKNPKAIEEQHQKQLEKLAGRMNASFNPEEDIDVDMSKAIKDMPKLSTDKLDVKKEKMQERMRKKLDRDGLVDSVIMAEVLGRPRALNPYENVLTRK